MKKYYMTSICRSEHLEIDPGLYKDETAPWYELHLYDDNTYDSFQKGYQWSQRKPVSDNGLRELRYLVISKQFSENKDEATMTSLPIHKRIMPTMINNNPEPPIHTWDIWIEGYSSTGTSCTAQCLMRGVWAETFKEACNIAARNMNFGDLDNEPLSVWGCRLYDNEADARKSFG